MSKRITVGELKERFPDGKISNDVVVYASGNDWWFVNSWGNVGPRYDGIEGKVYTDLRGHVCGGVKSVREVGDGYSLTIQERVNK